MTKAGQQLYNWALKNAEFMPETLRAVSRVFVAMADESRNPVDKRDFDEAAQNLWDLANATDELRAAVPI